MGAYLSEPITEKHSSDGTYQDRLSFGASSMQGWRISQEDAHNTIADYDAHSSLFAVYDGHGGAEVALYCKLYLPELIKEMDSYKKNNMSQALEDAFLCIDSKLISDKVQEELIVLAGRKEEPISRKDLDEEMNDLYREADMPLEELLATYKKNESEDNETEVGSSEAKPLNPQLKKLKGNEKPQSPFLRAKKSGEKSDPAPKLDLTNGGEAEETKEDVKDHCNEITKPTSDEPSSEPITACDSVDSASAEPTAIDSRLSANEQQPKNESSNGEQPETESAQCDSVVTSSDAEAKPNVSLLGGGDCKSTNEATSTVESTNGAGGSSGGSGMSSSAAGSSSGAMGSSGGSGSVKATVTSSGRKVISVGYAFGSSDEEDDDSEEEDLDESAIIYADEGSDSDEEEDEEEDEEDDDDEDDDDDEMNVTVDDDKEEPGYDSGCTAVLCLLRGNELYVANTGDSRCVLSRGGTAIDMSIDHKPEDPIETKRIHGAGGKITPDGRVNGGLNLSRAIGDHTYKANKKLDAKQQMITALPDIKTITLDAEGEGTTKDEFIVIACDGIWNSLTSQEVVDFVHERLYKQDGEKLTLSAICEQLCEHCLSPNTAGDGTGCDNMTVIIVQLHKLKPVGAAVNRSKKRTVEETSVGNSESGAATESANAAEAVCKKSKMADEGLTENGGVSNGDKAEAAVVNGN